MASMMLAHAVENAFERMARQYGSAFDAVYAGDIDAVKREWALQLQQVPEVLDAIPWALLHLPDRVPSLPQFRRLCEGAPRSRQQAMVSDSAPTRGPTPEERERLRQLAADIRGGTMFARPGRDWAQRVIDRHVSGEHPSTPAALAMAAEVVGQRANVPRGTYEPPRMPAQAAKPQPWDTDDDEPPWPELEAP